MHEADRKLALVRTWLAREGVAGVRLRGTDWFAWATCGGSNAVVLTTDVGVGEVLITPHAATVLTDDSEVDRLREEEVPRAYELFSCRWTERASAIDWAVQERTAGGLVASDRPAPGEVPLAPGLVAARWSLVAEEVERYRKLARDSAEAITEVLRAARPEWTGHELAGAGAEALCSRGIAPALTLAAGERRLPVHRDATAPGEKLAGRAMLAFCARRHGLFANLTRFVYFRPPTGEERALDAAVAEIEADVLDSVRPGSTLGALYDVFVRAYARAGRAGTERKHHQGGPCGYLWRDAVALPGSKLALQPDNAAAFNPSLPGARIEDTVLVRAAGVEVLTTDPRWPTRTVRGRRRPDLLVR